MIDSESTLDRALANLSKGPEPMSEVVGRIQRECRPRGAARRFSRLQRLVATLFVLGGGALLYLTSLRRMQGTEDSDWVHVSSLGGGAWAVAFAALLFAGLYQPPGRRGPRPARGALLALLLLVLFAYLGSYATSFLPLADRLSASLSADLLRCGSSATLGGGVIAVGMLVVWRRTDPFDPGVTGALVGLLGGLVGALTLGEVCPSQEAWHLWLGHGMAVLLVTVLGMLVGKRWLAP